MRQESLIALAGNPNCGKTTLFNAITGARHHVGNYPGVTVEKKVGAYQRNGHKLSLVDLPGVYSLTAYSLDERVAREFLVSNRPAVVINIVDASNLERNLYLTVQLLELGIPTVIALNMVDEAEARGIEIDAEELGRRLEIPVVPTVARTGKGTDELARTAAATAEEEQPWQPLRLSYGPDVDSVLDAIEDAIRTAGLLVCFYPPRWTALKILEGDQAVLEAAYQQNRELSDRLIQQVDKLTMHLKSTLNTYPEALIADYRYGFVRALLREGIVRRNDTEERLGLSNRLDKVFTNRFFGPILLLAIIYGMYAFTFSLSEYPVDWFESGIKALGELATSTISGGMIQSLVVSGIIDGVGGVLGFVPIIAFMFLAITFLEDTGYLARAAYMLDRVFRFFGLHGNSFMPFIISGGIAGGCAVPEVMASRILSSSRERIATILSLPFMNCGAKLPVFALLVGAFFPGNQAWMMFLITIISWGGAMIVARALRGTILRGPGTPFLLELPPYRLPTFKGLFIHTWERLWLYLKKAGTIILFISIILWAMMTFPGLPDEVKQTFESRRNAIVSELPLERQAILQADPEEEEPEAIRGMRARLKEVDGQEAQLALRSSLAGQIGRSLEPVSRLCGFDWRINVALVGGFAAKEVIVSTLGTALSIGEVDPEETGSLTERLNSDPLWNPIVAFSLIVFSIFYAPCFVTVVCIIRETGSWKWGLFSIGFNTIFSFALSMSVYQAGQLLTTGL
jgi:ferrous iron transport protein B